MSDSQGGAGAIDPAALAEITFGDPVVERRLLGVFRSANAVDVERLRAAMTRQDVPALVRAAHRIIGAARLVGAHGLTAICTTIARAGQCGDWTTIALQQAALETELAHIDAYLDRRLVTSLASCL